MTKVPHGIPARDFIDWVNRFTQDEAKRCRILLAELLLRTEGKKPSPPVEKDGEIIEFESEKK